MAGAGDADGKILTRGLMHKRGQFVFGAGLRFMSGDEGLIANPVTPVPAGPELRRRHWRDISHVVPSHTSCVAPRPRAAASRLPRHRTPKGSAKSHKRY